MNTASPRQPIPCQRPAELTPAQLECAQRRRAQLERALPHFQSGLSVARTAAAMQASPTALAELLRLAPVHRGEKRVSSLERSRRVLALPLDRLAPRRRKRRRRFRRRPLADVGAFFRRPQKDQLRALNHLLRLACYQAARLNGLSGRRAALSIGQSPVGCWKTEQRFHRAGLAALLPQFGNCDRRVAKPRPAARPSAKRILVAELHVVGNGQVKLRQVSLRTKRGGHA